jgi:hypothetical protein
MYAYSNPTTEKVISPMKTLIAAVLLLALASPAYAEWFLIFDLQTENCTSPSHCTPDKERRDFVTKETFATRKQCLAKGQRVIKFHNRPGPATESDAATEEGRIFDEMGNLYGDAEGSGVAQLHVRCEEGFEMSGTAAKWDCANNITALANRGQFYIEMGKVHEDNSYPDQGRWDLRRNGDLWINGRQCKQTN